ncbi:MAG: hypothetical protein AAF402_01345 [Pseudomonadota bacterium]
MQIRVVISLCASLLFAAGPVYALGPLDGELNLNLWNNDFDADFSEADIDAGSLTIDGDIWLADSWGLRGAYYQSDLEGTDLDNRNRVQLEIRRRFLSVSDNNFLAIGAGIEDISLENRESAQGLRLSLEGRIGLVGAVYIYGRAGLIPSLGDAGNFDDISAREFEAGVRFTPFPFVHFRLAYLSYSLDYEDTLQDRSVDTTSDGFLFGVGIHW